MKKIEDKRTFEYVTLFDSMLKGGVPVDKYDLLIALLMADNSGSHYDDSNGVYIINDAKYEKETYTREELINELKTDVRKGKKYKFDELNNRLDNTRKYIKKQLEKAGLRFDDIIHIRTDNSVRPSDRVTYYQYADPHFDLMSVYTPALNEDADAQLMSKIDSRYNLSDEFDIDRIKEAFHFQEKYSNRLKSRIVNEIRKIHSENNSFESIQNSKILKTLEYALLLNDPIKIACLLRRYIDFNEDRWCAVGLSSPNNSERIVYDCIRVIEKQLGNAVKDLEKISRGVSTDELFGESSEVFESVIYFLRSHNSADLPDALFSYAKYCMAISDFSNAEKLFRECLDFYDCNDMTTVHDRIVIHNNMGNMYGEWYHIQEAIEHIGVSIELITIVSKFMPESPNYILSLSYNTLASVYEKAFDYDKAEEALDKALEYIDAEVRKESYAYDSKVEYLGLMLMHNIAFLRYEQGDDCALLSLELAVFKAMLLAKKYPANENLLMLAILNITYANGLLKIGDAESARAYVNDALKIYDELCGKSYRHYALAKTFGLQRLADVYECNGQIEDAINALSEAKEICEGLDLKVNFEARIRRIEILNNLSALLVEGENYQAAISNCEEIIEEYRDLLSIDCTHFSFELVKELDNQAIAYYYNGEVQNACSKLDEALSVLAEIKEDIGDELYLEWKTKLLEDVTQMVDK